MLGQNTPQSAEVYKCQDSSRRVGQPQFSMSPNYNKNSNKSNALINYNHMA